MKVILTQRQNGVEVIVEAEASGDAIQTFDALVDYYNGTKGYNDKETVKKVAQRKAIEAKRSYKKG